MKILPHGRSSVLVSARESLTCTMLTFWIPADGLPGRGKRMRAGAR